MSRMSQVLASMVLTAAFLSPLSAQTESIKAHFMGTQQTQERPTRPGSGLPGVVANPTSPAIVFNPAAVGVSSSGAQTLDATFDVSGYSGSFTPTASFHYGHDYKLGTITCTGGSGSETCTVPVTFIPTLPGARKDALLLMDGSTVLATVLLGGTGQSGMSLIQPGVVTSPLSDEPFYIYQSVVDENGTVYFLVDNGNALYSYTKAGVLTELPLTGVSSPHAIDIDGAGTLYIAQNDYSQYIITYSATGVQGSIHVYPPPPYVFCSNSNGGSLEYLYSVAVDQGGNLFTLELLCNEIFELTPEGTYVTTAIDPSMIQPSEISVDAYDNLYIGGYDINVLTAAGVQTQVNTIGATEGIAADPAGTIYATRYTGVGGVAELPASNYTTSIANLDPAASPLGEGLGSDGTLYVGNYGDLDKVDRSQGAIAFGEQNVGVKSSVQYVSVYNGGNESLTVSNIAITGTSFALSVASSDPCKKGSVLAPGSFCQVGVTTTPPHAGTFSGTVTFTTNTLNTTATKQTVALSGYAYGPYVTASPTSVVFPPQLVGTTSATKSVTLTNNGDLYAAFIGTPSSSNSAFTVGIGTCTSELAVGSTCTLSVSFTPAALQSYTGTVTVPISSAGGGSWPALTFNVSGSGTWMELSPKSENFGSQKVGTTSAPKNVDLINKGTTTVTITSISITGADAGDFAQTNTCGSTLKGGSHCVISVTFTPSTTGKRTAQVSVSDNSGGSPQTATLQGNGTP